MTVYNETISATVQKFPIVAEAALQDLHDYHNNIMIQLRECFSGSLDIASEAILMDLDSKWNTISSYINLIIWRPEKMTNDFYAFFFSRIC